MIKIQVAKEFSRTPGPRFKREGRFSGEEFREKILDPRFREAERKGETLLIDLDGASGCPTSFLEEAFAGLARKYTAKRVLSFLQFKSDEEPYLIEDVQEYIAGVNSAEQASIAG